MADRAETLHQIFLGSFSPKLFVCFSEEGQGKRPLSHSKMTRFPQSPYLSNSPLPADSAGGRERFEAFGEVMLARERAGKRLR